MFEKLKSTENDGIRAFIICMAATLLQAIIFGSANSFPSMVSYIVDDPMFANNKPSTTDMFAALSVSLSLFSFFGLFSGELVHKIGSRLCCLITVVLMSIAFLGSSYAKNYHEVVGIYGVFSGISMGFLMSPTAVSISTWFVRRKSLGMGILFSGTGFGCLIIPPIIGFLLSHHTWRETLRYITLFQILAFICATVVIMRPGYEDEQKLVDEANKIKNTKRNQKISPTPEQQVEMENNEVSLDVNNSPPPSDVNNSPPPSDAPEERSINTHHATLHEWIFNILLTKSFLSQLFAQIFFSYGFFTFIVVNVEFPSTFLGKAGTIYAVAKPISNKLATELFIPYGISVIISGPMCGCLAAKFTDRFTFAFFSLLGAIGLGAMAACRLYWQFVIVNILTGFAIGSFALIPAIIGKRFFGPNLGFAIGINFFIRSIPGVVAPILASLLLEYFNNYTFSILLGGAGFLIAGILTLVFIDDWPGKPIISEGEKQKLGRLHRCNNTNN